MYRGAFKQTYKCIKEDNVKGVLVANLLTLGPWSSPSKLKKEKEKKKGVKSKK
jgi:hypothetical protein